MFGDLAALFAECVSNDCWRMSSFDIDAVNALAERLFAEHRKTLLGNDPESYPNLNMTVFCGVFGTGPRLDYVNCGYVTTVTASALVWTIV